LAINKNFKFNGRNLTLDLGKMSRLSASEKLSMLSDRSTRAMLSTLTAQQFASTFPEYYKRQLPDVGANLPGVRSLAPLSKEAAQNMQQGTATLYRENERIKTSRREMATPVPSWMRKVQAESGVNVSDQTAVAQLSDERKKLLEEMKQGNISVDDPRVAFLKDLPDDDLLKAGIKREKDASGEISAYSRAETTSSKLSDEAITDKLRNSSSGTFSPRERATLDFIANREGSKNADIIFGDKGNVPGTGKYSKALGLDKRPLSDHSISEVLDLQPKLTRITREDGVGGGRGTSAVGTGQMIRGTLLGNLRSLGIPESEWPKLKFDKTLQERLTLQNFKTSGIGDPNADPSTWNQARLGAQYESIDTRKGFRAMSQTEMQSIAGASPTKVIGPITSESIIVERKRLEEQERQQQETFLAGRTVPVLPEGVDPKFAPAFAKMSPGQKQRNVEAITKIGAAKFNELYQSAGSAEFLNTRIRDDATSQEVQNQIFKDAQNFNNRRISFHEEKSFRGLCGIGARSVAGALLNDPKFAKGLGEGGDWRAGSLSNRNRYLQNTGYYGEPQRIDDKQVMNKEYLDSLSIGTVISSAGGSRGFGHVQVKVPPNKWVSDFTQRGIHTKGQGEYTVHSPNAAGVTRMAERYPTQVLAHSGTVAHARNVGAVLPTPPPNEIAKDIKKGPPGESKPTPKEADKQIAQVNASIAQTAPAANTTVQSQATQTAPAANTTAPATQTAQATPAANTTVQAQATQTAPAANTTVQAQATAPTANSIPEIQAFAEGGNAQVNADEIRAMPIKNIKNDNSVVVDKKDNPIFTMNTKEETANFDPLTRQVSVSPINRDSPEDLMSQSATTNNSNNSNNNNNNNNNETDNNNNNNSSNNDRSRFDTGVQNYNNDRATSVTNMQSEFMNDPSYRRAIAKTRFVDSGDHSLGGHFGSSNADLS
jgi:hypothetical protein